MAVNKLDRLKWFYECMKKKQQQQQQQQRQQQLSGWKFGELYFSNNCMCNLNPRIY